MEAARSEGAAQAAVHGGALIGQSASNMSLIVAQEQRSRGKSGKGADGDDLRCQQTLGQIREGEQAIQHNAELNDPAVRSINKELADQVSENRRYYNQSCR